MATSHSRRPHSGASCSTAAKAGAAASEPDFFADLRLDQVVAALTAGREEYDLAGFFYRPLHEVEAVHYRHHVLSDLEQEPVLGAVREFAGGMRQMRKHLALMAKLHYARQQQRWFLEAASVYCDAVCALPCAARRRWSSAPADSLGCATI